jgi:hypothetical protein
MSVFKNLRIANYPLLVLTNQVIFIYDFFFIDLISFLNNNFDFLKKFKITRPLVQFF